jgi:hypothetical protein
MPEHRIRLRGGWECHYREPDDDEGIDVARRVDLPVATAAELPLRFRLTRHFGKPPVDPRVEAVALELRAVGGLRSVRLNGRVVSVLDVSSELAIDLDPAELLPRNGLVLEFDRTGLDLADDAWGLVALVIRPV